MTQRKTQSRKARASDNTLVLVDGSYYIFRAYHALPPLTNPQGEPTHVVYGVVNMLRKLRRDYESAYFAVVFDASGKSFRNDLYAEYKANRPPMPDDLKAQIEPLHRLIKALGIPMLVIDNVEADDVIGTLARQATDAGMHTVISSGDKDLAQLVDDSITIVNTMNSAVYDEAGVREKFGVSPNQIIDYLTLVGDSIDNIPGVPKVGPKTAAKWLDQYGSLDAIIEHADEIKGKVGEYLRASLDQLPLSRELVTLKCDVELDFRPADLMPGEPDPQTIRPLYEQHGFNALLREMDSGDAPEQPDHGGGDSKTGTGDSSSDAQQSARRRQQPARNYQTVLDQALFDDWLQRLQKAELFAFDTETTSLDYMAARIVGLSFAIQAGEAAYVPLTHDYPGAPAQLDHDTVLQQLKPLLENTGAAKVGHNLKYDMNVLANHGIELTGVQHDTMLESYVLNSVASRHDMDTLAEAHLDTQTTKYEQVAGKGAKQITFDQVAIDDAAPYAAEDADITLQLHETFWPQLEADADLKNLYETIEMPLVVVLSRMERNGVAIDADLLNTQSAELEDKMQAIERQAHDEAGQAFNIGSPKQIQTILYDKMQIPVTAKTPKGQPSTAESVLEELAEQYRLPQLILDHRGLSKLRSTYTDKLPKLVSPDTGRVHTSYHQAVTATGRLSSSDPNLQNIPIRTEEGRRIRQAFIAPSGYKILAADYSQIELRIMAHLSGDEGLLEAFAAGEDIHRATASEVFDTALDQVDSEQRRAAKAINFGLIYGMSAWGLGRQLGIERNAAQAYVDRYFRRYPGVKQFMDNTRAQARDRGYVETVFKRRLYLPDIRSKNGNRRQYAERTAINAPMQGTAADIIKRAMIRIDEWIARSKLDIRMVMQVHDELVFEIAAGDVDSARSQIRKFMTEAAELRIPLEVEAGVGDNWDEAH
ncbi:DNA polymerase-1 [Methylohalomonas lacus]|uniref:DNA polymerase I n=1 Tax=Methylohalomonas lacus TaxID=398773 RepID=A0AAE3HKW2_9GAMM|nr:DNA polymerase I [Methylohalomonas lacus]MCS3904221.1 DNA polymerase-1 [Methylohalomonas lacus]